MARRILFLDAYDSFTNNIVAMLKALPGVSVSVLKVDAPDVYLPAGPTPDALARFAAELSHYDAVVCGPGPGSPDNPADVGLMRWLWALSDADAAADGEDAPRRCPPVLGICLGFQSMVRHFGGSVRRLRRGLHGMVRPVVHSGMSAVDGTLDPADNIFAGVGPFDATLYHSLCVSVGQDGIAADTWPKQMWRPFDATPELIPLAWHTNTDAVPGYEGAGPERILMGIKHQRRPLWGLQYHPESACTQPQAAGAIANWLGAAERWNASHRNRLLVRDQPEFAVDCLRPSHLSALAALRAGQPATDPPKKMYAKLDRCRLSLPTGIETPDLLEMLQAPTGDQVILDSSNHGVSLPVKTADVRGTHSIIALDVENALRIEYRTGSSYAVASHAPLTPGGPRRLETLEFGSRYGSIWQLLAEMLERRKIARPDTPHASPFLGGFMGYLTYEMGLENIDVRLPSNERGHERPDLCFVWVTKSLAVNHREGFVDIQHLRHNSDEASLAGHDWVSDTAAKLQQSPLWASPSAPPTVIPAAALAASPSEASLTRLGVTVPSSAAYSAAVSTCQQYIAAGESYELCLTDQTTIRLPRPRHEAADSHRWRMFRNLRQRQPVPFGSYIRLGGATLISSSPERFLNTLPTGLCTMRPMKGTVRKSAAVTTVQQAEKLLHIPKEIAENLMIVDLVRHDLQGVCAPGAVQPTHLMKVEEYATVFTMVTVIEAQLPTGYTGLDALAASFPPGSMTGAPKKRSCEILTRIERGVERSMYSGVVGYMDAAGQADWSVTIRSLFSWADETLVDANTGCETEVWRIGAGGAVTTLSTPEGETEEMFLKLAGPLGVLESIEI